MKKSVLTLVLVSMILLFSACQQTIYVDSIGNGDAKNPVLESPKPVSVTLDYSKMIELEAGHVYAIVAADFNNDGYDDIVTGVFNGISNVYLNNKDGTFAKNPLSVNKYNVEALGIIDIDNDGKKDLIVGSNAQQITVFRNNGDGTFELLKELDKVYVTGISVADFDKDDYEDFAVSTMFNGNHVYFNDQNNGFVKVTLPEVSNELAARAITVADFDNDNLIDIVIGLDSAPSRVYLNDGNRNFVLNFELQGAHTYALGVIDANNDGKTDIIQGNNKDQNNLYMNSGNSFEAKPEFGYGNTYALAVADLDSDNVKEVVVGNYEQTIQIYKKNGEDYSLLKEISTPFRNFVEDLAIGDFDKDGKMDIAVARDKEMSQVYLG